MIGHYPSYETELSLAMAQAAWSRRDNLPGKELLRLIVT